MNEDIICPYCNKPATLKTGKDIYPNRKDLRFHSFWVCAPCQARVGCHPESIEPLGTLANAELRNARMRAHNVFDPKWKNGGMSRFDAYAWLAKRLRLPSKETHIGSFNEEQCRMAIDVCLNKDECTIFGHQRVPDNLGGHECEICGKTF